MSIYKKNQPSVSQKHTKDFSRLSNEDDDMLSREHNNLSAASNPRVLVENYGPKQAPNLPFGQNLPLCILT